MMDRIDGKVIEKINSISFEKTCSLLGQETLDVLFYDTTSLYFETDRQDRLRQKGYSKDGKPHCSQVILALLVTKEGLPVGYRVFPGAKYEGHTLLPVLKELSQKYKLGHLVFVADSGLLTEENLSLMEKKAYSYVVGARLKGRSLKKDEQAQVLDKGGYKTLREENGIKELFREIEVSKKKGRRLLVTYHSKRAKKDAEKKKRSYPDIEKETHKEQRIKRDFK